VSSSIFDLAKKQMVILIKSIRFTRHTDHVRYKLIHTLIQRMPELSLFRHHVTEGQATFDEALLYLGWLPYEVIRDLCKSALSIDVANLWIACRLMDVIEHDG
jgi:hypothetical protein